MTSLGGLFRALPGETIDASSPPSTPRTSARAVPPPASRRTRSAPSSAPSSTRTRFRARRCTRRAHQQPHRRRPSRRRGQRQRRGDGPSTRPRHRRGGARGGARSLRQKRDVATHRRLRGFRRWRAVRANLRWELTARFDDPRLPTLSAEGLIEHCPAAGGVLTKLRPEDALRRELETPRVVAIDEPNRQPRDDDGGAEGSGVEGKSPSGFHASMLRMLGRSPRSVAPRSEDSRGASTPSPDGMGGVRGGRRGSGSERSSEQGSTSESERRQPRVARNILGDARRRRTRRCWRGRTAGRVPRTGRRVPASLRDDAPAGSGEWSDGESEPGRTPRRARPPRPPSRGDARGRGARGDGGDARERRRRRAAAAGVAIPRQERDGRETLPR